MRNSRRIRGMLAAMYGLLLLVVIFRVSISASEPASCELYIRFTLMDETPIANAKFRIYRAAELPEGGGYALTEAFRESGAELSSQMTNEEWAAAVGKLTDWMKENDIDCDKEGATANDGTLTFKGLQEGLYLVDGDSVEIEGRTILPESFCVTLPGKDQEGARVDRVECDPKYVSKDLSSTEKETGALPELPPVDETDSTEESKPSTEVQSEEQTGSETKPSEGQTESETLSTGEQTEESTESPTGELTEKPGGTPSEGETLPTEGPTENETLPTEGPTESETLPTEKQTEESTEEPTGSPAEGPTEPPAEEQTEKLTEGQTETSTEKPTEPSTEGETLPTEGQTGDSTEKQTEPLTESETLPTEGQPGAPTESETPSQDEAGRIEVRKDLRCYISDDSVVQIYARDQTFYAALFEDPECTVMASEIKPLRFVNSASATAVFEGLEAGKHYYLGEVDAGGDLLEDNRGILHGGITDHVLENAEGDVVFRADFSGGNEAVMPKGNETTHIAFSNVFYELPQGFNLNAVLNITKVVLGPDGNRADSNDTFYAGIFADPEFTELSEDVEYNIIPLHMGGNSRVSDYVNVGLQEVGEKLHLYVTEVDEDGVPVDSSFDYSVSVSGDGAVSFDENSLEQSVVITNQMLPPTLKPAPAPTETSKPAEILGETGNQKETGAQKEAAAEADAAKTGDDTPLLPYMGYMLLAMAAMCAAAGSRMKGKGK